MGDTAKKDLLINHEKLEELGYDCFLESEVTFIPSNYISLDEETSNKAINLIEDLEELDDVGEVYHNLEL